MMTNVMRPAVSATDEVARDAADRAQMTAEGRLPADGDGSRLHGVLKPADVGTAAAHDAGTGPGHALVLDENGCLPAVDGSRLHNLPASGVDTSETETAPVVTAYKRFSDGAFIATASPSPEPAANLARAQPDHTTDGGILHGTVDVLGIPGSDYEAGGAAFQRLVFVSTEIDMQAGDSLQVAYAIKPLSVANGEALRLYIFLNGVYERIDLNYAGANAGSVTLNANSDWSGFAAHWREPTTADDASANVVTADLGGGTYIVQFKLEATAAVAGTLELRQAGFDTNDRFALSSIYTGLSPYRYDADDGREAVKLPGEAGTATLTLTTAANQAVTVATPGTALVLPAPPPSGVRDILVRVACTGGGSLALPPAGVTVFGSAGPFSSDVRLAIRQYGDGSPADIFAATGS